MTWGNIRLWAAAALLLDAGFGLWFEGRLSGIAPRLNFRAIAFIEGSIALALLIWHFWVTDAI